MARPRRAVRWRPSLRTYLIALLVLFAVVVGAASLYQRQRSLDDVRGTVARQIDFRADLAAEEIDEALVLTQASLTGLADNPDLATLFARPATPGCSLTFTGAGPFTEGHIAIVDIDGTVLCSSTELPDGPVYAGSTWLDTTQEGPQIAGPMLDAATGRRALLVSAPYQDLGMIITSLALDSLAPTLEDRLGDPVDARFALINPGDPTAFPEPGDEDRITGTAQVPTLGWQVEVWTDRAEASAQVDEINRQLLWFLVAAFLVLLVVVQLLYRGIASPIRRLSTAVRGTMAGDAPRPVQASGPKEVVHLAEDFSTLAEGMQAELDHRRQAEAEAVASRERYRTIFDANPQPMWVHDEGDGHFIEVNEAMVARFGWSRQELLTMSVDELLLEGASAPLLTQLAGQERVEQSGPWPLVGRDDRRIECEITAETIRLGDQTGRLVVAEDVTAQLRTQRLLHQAERMESLGQLAGGIAHDFNNLLAVMLNYADFAGEELADAAREDPDRWEPVLRDVEEVGSAGRRAATLTRQLLSFARGETAAVGPLDINDVATDMEQLLRRTLGEQIALELSLQPDLWTVEANAGQMEQLIVNLAVNARDAMPDGGRLAIETSNVDVDAEHVESRPELSVGRYVRLRVSDTGMGMDAEARDHAFEPFFTTKALGSGTGLGLATVYGVVSRAGGVIHIYSEPGMGTSVSALFPASGSAAEAPTGVGPRAPVHAGDETVLVVEDDDALRAMAERILAREGYRVLTAPDGEAALEMARQRSGQIDLLLTDVVMPGMLGSELALALAEREPTLRVVFMSGYAPPVLLTGGTLPLSAALIDKPFSAQLLLEKVREALDAPPPDAPPLSR